MRDALKISVAIMIGTLANTAIAAPCDDMRNGNYPQVWPLQKLIDTSIKATSAKGEFETTAAYKQRLAKAAAPMTNFGEIVVAWPLDHGFAYDADAGVATYSMRSLPTECSVSKFGLSGDVKAVTFGERARYDVLEEAKCFSRSFTTSITGEGYVAQNAFGARVKVTPIQGSSGAIFFGFGDRTQEVWADQPKGSYKFSSPLFSAKLDGPSAKSLKENGVALIVLRPVVPYYFIESTYLRPTYRNPIEGRSVTHNVVAEIQCVGVADPKVRKTYQVRTLAHRTHLVEKR